MLIIIGPISDARTGRVIRKPDRLIETMTGTAIEMRMLSSLADLDNRELSAAAFDDPGVHKLAAELNLCSRFMHRWRI
jgi:hypothetical protein